MRELEVASRWNTTAHGKYLGLLFYGFQYLGDNDFANDNSVLVTGYQIQ